MTTFELAAVLLCLSALFGFVNQRWLRLPAPIGVVVIALTAAVRGSGSGDLAEIAAIVLETDGSISVIRSAGGAGETSTLSRVGRRPDDC